MAPPGVVAWRQAKVARHLKQGHSTVTKGAGQHHPNQIALEAQTSQTDGSRNVKVLFGHPQLIDLNYDTIEEMQECAAVVAF